MLKKPTDRKFLTQSEKIRIAEATERFSEGFSALDAEKIIAMLAEDIIYEGQHITHPIEGKPEVSQYIRNRFKILRERKTEPILELAEVTLPLIEDYPCAVGLDNGSPSMIFSLTLSEEVTRIDLYSILPRPEDARRSGVIISNGKRRL